MSSTILRQRSIVPACDTASMDRFREIVRGTADDEKVGAYKVGFSLGLRYGLPNVTAAARELAPDKPIIYDHQKAGGDIPDTGEDFAAIMEESKVSAAIIFPHSGPETEKAWIKALQARRIRTIVGAVMTHKGYLTTEGGWIDADRIWEALDIAADAGITEFVGPGTKVDILTKMKARLLARGIENPIIYAPGLIAQGGNITDAAKAAGESFHAIVGRAIMKAENPGEAAKEYGSQL